MTKHRILDLAYLQALDIWVLHREKAERFPDCEVFRKLEQKAWDEAEELHEMLVKEERRLGI